MPSESEMEPEKLVVKHNLLSTKHQHIDKQNYDEMLRQFKEQQEATSSQNIDKRNYDEMWLRQFKEQHRQQQQQEEEGRGLLDYTNAHHLNHIGGYDPYQLYNHQYPQGGLGLFGYDPHRHQQQQYQGVGLYNSNLLGGPYDYHDYSRNIHLYSAAAAAAGGGGIAHPAPPPHPLSNSTAPPPPQPPIVSQPTTDNTTEVVATDSRLSTTTTTEQQMMEDEPDSTQRTILIRTARYSKMKRQYQPGTNYNSIIPCAQHLPNNTVILGTQRLDSKSTFDKIAKRVKNECNLLCLLPNYAPSINDGWSKSKWLYCATSLIFSSLNLESPNPVGGWDDNNNGRYTSPRYKERIGCDANGDDDGSSQLYNGVYHRLYGPQPWQCTRPFIIKMVYQLLVAEGYENWLISNKRWKALEKNIRPIIVTNLRLWQPSIFVHRDTSIEENLIQGNPKVSNLVKHYSKLIWNQFKMDELDTISDCEEALVPPQIGYAYVCQVAKDLGALDLRQNDNDDDGGDEEEEEKDDDETVEDDENDDNNSDEEAFPQEGAVEVSWEDENLPPNHENDVAVQNLWKCDFCPRSFESYEEAASHENECKTKSQEERDQEVLAEANETGEDGHGYIMEEKWKCEFCSASFHVYDECVAHEEECKVKSEAAAGNEAAEENESYDEDGEVVRIRDYVLEETWKCEFCPAQFSNYNEANAHEVACKLKSEGDKSSPASPNQSDEVEEDGTPEQEDGGGALETCWKCDFCPAEFSDYDEANEHEAKCKLKSEEAGKSLPSSTSQSNETAVDDISSEELRLKLLETLNELQYDYFPLMRGGDVKLAEVADKVLKCMHAITPITHEREVSTKRRVESVLHHLEHERGYLSSLNEILRVRVNTKALKNVVDSPPDSQSFTHREEGEAVVVTYGSDSNGDYVVMAADSPPPRKRAKGEVSKPTMHTKGGDRPKPCGKCILCNAPNCEQCFICNSEGQSDEGAQTCIRKSCCKIPFEQKAHSLDGLGFPSGWQFAFCDPAKGMLVKSPRRTLPLAGLVLRSPQTSTYFYSFEAAFSEIQDEDSDVGEATKLVESFFSHVHGANAMKSFPDHILVGRKFCHEFTSAMGTNVAMMGTIAACLRESSEAANCTFLVQYDSDCLKIAAKCLDTHVRPLQLISSQLAWGGCILFEHKASIYGRQSVVRSIDQATAVEYWVTPDMRMEEMVMVKHGTYGTMLPQLTIVLRGYKLVFGVNIGDNDYRVSVSCTSIHGEDDVEYDSILKPGELIDLGVFCPLLDSDTKPLPAFILKNYLHNFAIDPYSGDGNGNVYDLTNDSLGVRHGAAMQRVLSFVQRCNETEIPTIHGGLDPSGRVHLLFGVRYNGDWDEYTSTMQEQILPVFRGEEREVTLPPNIMTNEDQEAKHLAAIKQFGPEELVQCAKVFPSLAVGISSVMAEGGVALMPPSEMKERLIRVAFCLRERISELKGIPLMADADELIRGAIYPFERIINIKDGGREQHS